MRYLTKRDRRGFKLKMGGNDKEMGELFVVAGRIGGGNKGRT
jgi:hypothetical protein